MIEFTQLTHEVFGMAVVIGALTGVMVAVIHWLYT